MLIHETNQPTNEAVFCIIISECVTVLYLPHAEVICLAQLSAQVVR
jgi:hypothetical protein